jgi:serine/threonine-protein kinase RIO1
MARSLLERDLANINRFFSKLGVKVLTPEQAYKKVAG